MNDLPRSTAAAVTSAELFVLVEGHEFVRLGKRGATATTEVSDDELLRAFWRMRGDPLGGRGAASPSAAPLVIAGASVPAARVLEVVAILWQHGARLAVDGGVAGAAREHPVRLLSEQAQAPREVRGPTVELGASGLLLSLPGAEAQGFDGCGSAPNTSCLVRALDAAAKAGVRTVFVRRGNSQADRASEAKSPDRQ